MNLCIPDPGLFFSLSLRFCLSAVGAAAVAEDVASKQLHFRWSILGGVDRPTSRRIPTNHHIDE